MIEIKFEVGYYCYYGVLKIIVRYLYLVEEVWGLSVWRWGVGDKNVYFSFVERR